MAPVAMQMLVPAMAMQPVSSPMVKTAAQIPNVLLFAMAPPAMTVLQL
jgi:hypothetical protein